jgi:hypothetical protein
MDFLLEELVPDPQKVEDAEKFIRGGGTRKTRKGRRCHGHSGSGCCHSSAPGMDCMDKHEYDQYIERQATRFNADLEANQD